MDENKYIEDLVTPVSDIMEQANNDIIDLIINRIKKIGSMSAADAQKISMVARRADLKKIEQIIADATDKSLSEIDKIFDSAAEHNDSLADELYKARNLPAETYLTNAELMAVLDYAKQNVVDEVSNLSKTIAFLNDGKMNDVSTYYNNVINKAIYSTQIGTTDYFTAMRKTIRELAENGVRVAKFESGYHRRIDSQVRMNVLDGVRLMNMNYRKAQGDQYGADCIFISYHFLCATDHQFINGQQYTLSAWEKISQTLKRPVGQMNCHHYITYGIQGVSENPITKEQRADAIKNSNGSVTVNGLSKDADGNTVKITMTKYELSQMQRRTETEIRRIKDVRDKYTSLGDDVMAKKYDKKARERAKYYREISRQGGLAPQPTRLNSTARPK